MDTQIEAIFKYSAARLNTLEVQRGPGQTDTSDGTNGRTTFFASPLPLNTRAVEAPET